MTAALHTYARTPCQTCSYPHPPFEPGRRYSIEAEDCCLQVEGLELRFDHWEPDDGGEYGHSTAVFDGGVKLSEGWAMSGWDVELLP